MIGISIFHVVFAGIWVTFLCLLFQITSQVGPSTGVYYDDHLMHVTFSCSLTL